MSILGSCVQVWLLGSLKKQPFFPFGKPYQQFPGAPVGYTLPYQRPSAVIYTHSLLANGVVPDSEIYDEGVLFSDSDWRYWVDKEITEIHKDLVLEIFKNSYAKMKEHIPENETIKILDNFPEFKLYGYRLEGFQIKN
tara:strand:+ start:57 stop:470 length:414 start_codon:yes stop_codon:yes gene_type:complete